MRKYKFDIGWYLLGDYVKFELEKKERLVWENDFFVVVCLWWVLWLFEVFIIFKCYVRVLVDLDDKEWLEFVQVV